MARVEGVEPSYSVLETDVIAVIRHPPSSAIADFGGQSPRVRVGGIFLLKSLFHFFMLRVLLAEFAVFGKLELFLDLLFVSGGIIGDPFAFTTLEFHHVFLRFCGHMFSF